MTQSVKIQVIGSRELNRALAKMSDEIERKVGIEVEQTAQEVRTEIIRKYNNPPASGTVTTSRRANGTLRTHQASKVGEYPMSDTGRLAGGTTYKRLNATTSEIFNNVKYALGLEFGVRGKGGRPAWRDTADETQGPFLKRLEKILFKEVKK